MGDYIRRENLLKDEEEPFVWYDEDYEIAERNEWRRWINKIKNAEAADVEEVVRCKDCKHHCWEQEPCHGRTEHFCKLLKREVNKEFYCAYGVIK